MMPCARSCGGLWCLAASSLAVLALMVAGCQKQQQKEDQSKPEVAEPALPGSKADRLSVKDKLVARARPPIEDVPVPVDFHLEDAKSRAFLTAEHRYVDHTYKGQASTAQLVRYFRDRLPVSGWKNVGERLVRGAYQMEFEKGNERCQITITKDWFDKYIHILIFPLGSAAK